MRGDSGAGCSCSSRSGWQSRLVSPSRCVRAEGSQARSTTRKAQSHSSFQGARHTHTAITALGAGSTAGGKTELIESSSRAQNSRPSLWPERRPRFSGTDSVVQVVFHHGTEPVGYLELAATMGQVLHSLAGALLDQAS